MSGFIWIYYFQLICRTFHKMLTHLLPAYSKFIIGQECSARVQLARQTCRLVCLCVNGIVNAIPMVRTQCLSHILIDVESCGWLPVTNTKIRFEFKVGAIQIES